MTGRAEAVVVAAGMGERLGRAAKGQPKALVELAGRPLLLYAVERLAPLVDRLVVVHPPGFEDDFAEALRTVEIGQLVPGGATRSDSVRAGVAVLDDPGIVAIHDAARALVPEAVIRRVLAAITGDVVAAAPGLPVPDTVKRLRRGVVTETVDREGLWAAHTPQVIRADVLSDTFAWAGERAATDDLALVEEAIADGVVTGRVVLVPGDPRDLKVTYPADLDMAEALVRAEMQPPEEPR